MTEITKYKMTCIKIFGATIMATKSCINKLYQSSLAYPEGIDLPCRGEEGGAEYWL